MRFYAAEIAVALDHLHDRGLIHCDLSVENVLIATDGHVVLSSMRVTNVGPEPSAGGHTVRWPNV